MGSVPLLTTARLVLRPLDIDDAAAAQRLFPHWEIVRYLDKGAVPWPYPPDGAVTFFRDHALPAMARGEEWTWTLRLKTAPDAMIGMIALQDRADNHRGFWLGLPWQGQGYMTEACEAATGFWFDVLGRPVLRAPRATANLASRRIAEKTGMRLVGRKTMDFVSGTMEAEIWEITREDWQARR
ncbi:MAG TPA: GNAT family N-acetyltransferase [Stellaceae bacterium]|nr:GNAT family N-acetyltransferase [Stellaceae bacterium]